MAKKTIQNGGFQKGLVMGTVDRLGILCIVLLTIFLRSCIEMQDAFRSTKLVSSAGEEFYINSLNWGATHDYQYTVVSKDRNRLRERRDTVGGVEGLTPFVYQFSYDTLYVFFPKEDKITISENFESIQLKHIPLENTVYMDLLNKAIKGEEGYQTP